ncbi:MAG: hypothetical protein RIB59_14100 [Rhodospirillales bacterium]
MTTKIEATHRANAATAIALGMEAAADQGVPDEIIANEIIKIALGLIGMVNGGPENVPDALRRLADEIEANPNDPKSLN